VKVVEPAPVSKPSAAHRSEGTCRLIHDDRARRGARRGGAELTETRATIVAVVLVDRVRRFVPTSHGRQLVLVVAVGGLLRLAWGLWAMRDTPEAWQINGDQYSYWYFGNEIANGRGYRSYITGDVTSYYPVGYPALLGVVYWLGLNTPLPADHALLTAGLHVVLATTSILLVYLIARKVFDHHVGIVSAWIMALFPSLIFGVGTYSVETTFIFSALVCVAILVDHDWTQPMSRARLIGFGAALGCSILVRPFLAPVLIGLAVAGWMVGRSWRSALRHLGWAAITLALVLTPWTIRNEIRFDRFIPVSTNLGDGLCMSRFPGSDGGFSWAAHEYCADPDLPEAERNPANTRAAIRFVLDHPDEELRQIPQRFFKMMANDRGTLAESLGNGSRLALPSGLRGALDSVSDWYYHVTWVLALGGLVLLARGWRGDPVRGPRRAIVAVTVAGLVVIPVALWGNPRFHTPLLPFIAMLAAASISWITRRVRDAETSAPSSSSTNERTTGTSRSHEVVAASRSGSRLDLRLGRSR